MVTNKDFLITEEQLKNYTAEYNKAVDALTQQFMNDELDAAEYSYRLCNEAAKFEKIAEKAKISKELLGLLDEKGLMFVPINRGRDAIRDEPKWEIVEKTK